jgi:hypothetical protein
MFPKSGRCPNAGTNLPWEVMEHVDCTGMTDWPGAQCQRRGSMPGLDAMAASLGVWPGLKPINEALKTA